MHEEEAGGEMYSIGEMAKMVGISTDTLRYYDEIGLLVPHETSQETKYRYYTTDQAIALAWIMELKQFGFTLREIKDILGQGDAALTNAYLNRFWVLEEEKKKIQQAIDELSKKIKQKMEGSVMNKKVLLADDSEFMRMMCKDILFRNGYDVVGEASDGFEAVEMYKKNKPDIILLNIEMPHLKGLDALRIIKEFDNNANVVMLTALCNTKTVINAILSGAKDFVAKPFQAAFLMEKINHSFFQASTPNKEVAEKALTSVEDRNFTQLEIDSLIKIIHSQTTAFEVEFVINSLKNGNLIQLTESMSAASQFNNINDRLEKLERSQEEILEILRNKQEGTKVT